MFLSFSKHSSQLKLYIFFLYYILIYQFLIQRFPMPDNQINSTLPLARKSFKNLQTIKRKYTPPFSLIAILFTCIMYLYISKQFTTQSEQPHEKEAAINTTQLYLSNYCQYSNCQPHHMHALSTILDLMQVQLPQLPSQQPHIEQVNSEVDTSQGVSSSTSFEEQVQINSNWVIQQNSKNSINNGQSKLKQIPLFIIKHRKVTTPIQLSLTQKLSSFFISRDQYQNIDKIVSNSHNHTYWFTNTKITSIGVRSNVKIHPKTIEIQVFTHSKQQIFLQFLGLNVDINKSIVLSPLGKSPIKHGVNRINCLRGQCNEGYEGIILKVQSVSIRRIRLFQSKQ